MMLMTQKIDLTKIETVVLHCASHQVRYQHMTQLLQSLGMSYSFFNAHEESGYVLSATRSLMALFEQRLLVTPFRPFLFLEDDVSLTPWTDSLVLSIPCDADAVYLGASIFSASPISETNILGVPYRELEGMHDFIQIDNMLSQHAVLVLKPRWLIMLMRAMTMAATLQMNWDIPAARVMNRYCVYAKRKPMFYQDAKVGGQEEATLVTFDEIKKIEFAPSAITTCIQFEPPMAYAIDNVKPKTESKKQLIAFSLWGENPAYLIGALRNVELAAKLYPDWVCRFYCANDLAQEFLNKLQSYRNVEIVLMPPKPDRGGAFWRFLATEEVGVSHILFRDTDSRISVREVAAVSEWLISGKPFHLMRDHPFHWTPIMAGMWGCKGGAIEGMQERLSMHETATEYGSDQQFLAGVLYPLIKNNCVIHDAFNLSEAGLDVRSFPTQRQGLEFVGQCYDEHDQPNTYYEQELAAVDCL